MDSKLRPRLSGRQRKHLQRPPPKPPLVETSAGVDHFPCLVCEIDSCAWGLWVRKQKPRHLAIIKALSSEVWLGLIRKTDVDGKGRGLRGKTQSSDARRDLRKTAAAD